MNALDLIGGGSGGGTMGGAGGAADIGGIAANVGGASFLPWLQAASPLVSAALKPGAGAGPSRADSTVTSVFNSSGWSVATGQGNQASAAATSTPLAGVGSGSSLALIAAALLGLWIWKRA